MTSQLSDHESELDLILILFFGHKVDQSYRLGKNDGQEKLKHQIAKSNLNFYQFHPFDGASSFRLAAGPPVAIVVVFRSRRDAVCWRDSLGFLCYLLSVLFSSSFVVSYPVSRLLVLG